MVTVNSGFPHAKEL